MARIRAQARKRCEGLRGSIRWAVTSLGAFEAQTQFLITRFSSHHCDSVYSAICPPQIMSDGVGFSKILNWLRVKLGKTLSLSSWCEHKTMPNQGFIQGLHNSRCRQNRGAPFSKFHFLFRFRLRLILARNYNFLSNIETENKALITTNKTNS